MSSLGLLPLLAFALVHLFVGRLKVLDVLPRSRWLSAAGGVAVAYVFLHILPELALHAGHLEDPLGEERAEALTYLMALAGLAAFYGLERAAKTSRARSRRQGGADRVETELFWLHIGSFALYNALIGYLLLRGEERGPLSLLLYAVAMGLHFLTTDHGLREHHNEAYDRRGRWVLVAAVLGGGALGVLGALPPAALALLFAFLAGGVVLNVLKEELPEERESNFGAFAAGAAGYAALLLLA
jgi:zinc transporter ZupT